MQKIVVRRVANSLLNTSDLHPVLQRIYSARDINTTDDLDRKLSGLLHYQTLLNIDLAAELLVNKLMQQETIVIIGDYDADGATSSALAVSALQAMGAQRVNFIVPNRFTYGYGLTPEIVDIAAKQQPGLIVTVDNGIANHDGVNRANEYGIPVLITDHHLPATTLPAAAAIVNPNQTTDQFASKNLAGVGVMFYLLLALRVKLREQQWFQQQQITEPNLADWLDLVALGTVADVVPLDKNNRILVYQGIQRIRAGRCRPGIIALLEIAKRHLNKVSASDLAFSVAPRLNAAGRLDDMSLGIACLLAPDIAKARQLAAELDALNHERRHIEVDMQQQAVTILQTMTTEQTQTSLPAGICLFEPSWHQGVIGILAARIKDKYQRPVIAFAVSDDNTLKGSARSVHGVHIRDVLAVIAAQHPQLIIKFGGHAMAAGLSIAKDAYEQFNTLFALTVAQYLNVADINHQLYSDGELTANDLTLELALALNDAGPFGQKFPEPLFDGKFKILDQRLINNRHLKLILQPLDGELLIDAIAFNIDIQQWPKHRATEAHVVYRLDINEFRGLQQIQMIVEHIE